MLKTDGWDPKNHAAIVAFLAEESRRPGRKVAVFDWDNTVIKNDIGDAAFIGLLDRGMVATPDDWRRTSPYLTDAAVQALKKGATPESIFTIYNSQKTPDGQAAFAGHDPNITEAAYAWLGHLLAGNTPDQIRRVSREIFERQLANPIGATRRIGNDTIADYIRIYPQIADLIDGLKKSGFEVWVVSATPKYIIDPCAALVGIPRERVIGIENVVGPDGKLTYDLIGCGPVKDGENRMITYRDGKRCWINTVIFGMTAGDPFRPNPGSSAEGFGPQADPAKRPRFGAGDSDGDISFLRDTTGLRLFIDKGKTIEAQREATGNKDGRWLIQEPFIR
ncbi:MAG TPA: haloacid dehalogenase-like hydrolase [bacterium]|nr:haloacid dehalogenase-like hydrolase [bacterium]